MVRWLQKRILKLEAEKKAYEQLLAELPDLFEHKFQHRLEPIIERYRLLAEQVNPTETSQPAQLKPAPENVVRFPVLRLPRFLSITTPLRMSAAVMLTTNGSAVPRHK